MMKRLAFVAVMSVGFALVGCGGPCKDLEAKKPDCKKAGAGTPAAAAMQTACEASIDAVVKADNKDACKAAMDGIGQMTK